MTRNIDLRDDWAFFGGEMGATCDDDDGTLSLSGEFNSASELICSTEKWISRLTKALILDLLLCGQTVEILWSSSRAEGFNPVQGCERLSFISDMSYFLNPSKSMHWLVKEKISKTSLNKDKSDLGSALSTQARQSLLYRRFTYSRWWHSEYTTRDRTGWGDDCAKGIACK